VNQEGKARGKREVQGRHRPSSGRGRQTEGRALVNIDRNLRSTFLDSLGVCEARLLQWSAGCCYHEKMFTADNEQQNAASVAVHGETSNFMYRTCNKARPNRACPKAFLLGRTSSCRGRE
jgi:hypothetical protein